MARLSISFLAVLLFLINVCHGQLTRSSRRGGRRTKEDASDAESASNTTSTKETDDEAPKASRSSRSSKAASAGSSSSTGEAEETRRPRRRRRSKRSESAEPKTEGDSAEEVPHDDEAEANAGATKKKRRRGTRGGRGRRKKSGAAVEIESIPGEDDELPEIAELPEDAVRVDKDDDGGKDKKAKRKKTRRKAAKSETKKDAKKTSKREAKSSKKATRTTKRSRKRGSTKDDDEPTVVPEEEPSSVILVNAVEPEETRVAVVSEGRIVDLQMSVRKRQSYVTDIYRGRVVNLEPAIGAAFVDFGQGRNGFLHASDVLSSYGDPNWSLDQLLTTPIDEEADADADFEDEGKDKDKDKAKAKDAKKGRRGGRGRRQRQPIEKLLKKGQMVVVQITKDAIGDKGPTLTTHISIPGRYLVLMPSLERTGVSRKIDDDRERRRLKRILSALDIPEGMGVIVRTAGVGKTKADIQRDLKYLLLAWEDFSRRLQRGRNPAPLYQESDVAVRTMRDLFSSSTEKVVVDEDDVFERMKAFTEKLMPEHLERLHFHKGPRPIFHSHGVEQDFEKIFARRVELPSGGSIVIDQTEALVAIDVNSGRTREEGAEFEDIALKTNLEAVEEIARQIRLRDLGGIIVLDYIDMMRASGRRAVERATREALGRDRARSKIGRISQFGLLELTRQRLGPGLSKLVYETCLRCRGSGRQRNASSKAQAILRRLGAALTLKGFTSVEVRAHPEVIEYLKKNLNRELDTLENDSGRKLILMSVPEQIEDSVLHYLRADGREVRPGGRRKR